MPAATNRELDTLVRERLAVVLDPCGVRNGTRLSFVDLGMYDGVEELGPAQVRVRMLLDDPICMYMAEIITAVRAAVLEIDGIEQVEVQIVGDQFWTPDRLTPETTEKMRRWREIRQRRMADRGHHVTPTRDGAPA